MPCPITPAPRTPTRLIRMPMTSPSRGTPVLVLICTIVDSSDQDKGRMTPTREIPGRFVAQRSRRVRTSSGIADAAGMQIGAIETRLPRAASISVPSRDSNSMSLPPKS